MSTPTANQERTDILQEKDLFDEALRLRDQGNLERATEILLGIAKRHPAVAATFGILGGIFNELGRFAEAEHYYRKATIRSPTSELAARGLFHSLWDQGKPDEAAAELRRYIQLCGSEEFEQIVKDIEDWKRKKASDGGLDQ